MSDINKAWRLLQALKSEEKFANLTLDEKLEALRLHTIQSIHKATEGGSDNAN